jgi:exopolyphosphatase/guanosine-5'-triphosphate,3'-diphosphate pyrophosphatase
LAALVRKLTRRSAKARAQIPGISSDRADVIAAGAITYLTILEATDQEGLYVSGSGIREGLLYRELFPFPHLVPEVRGFTVQMLAKRYLEPSAHPTRVQNLAEQIFDGLAPLHLLGTEAKRLLSEAAYLSEIGNHVSPYQSHLHGEYLLTAQSIPGFSHREQAALALLVRYQHKGTPKLGAFARLGFPAGAANKLLQLAVILRLAQSFERVKAGRVQQVEIGVESGVVKIEVHSSEGLELELWEARKHSQLFQTAFGQRLEVIATMHPATINECNKQSA